MIMGLMGENQPGFPTTHEAGGNIDDTLTTDELSRSALEWSVLKVA